ncbi:hypothetical protein [Vibrio salinus]|uniref:hypothetical protein n=1 Tax=Vibrio salinus TaxID=2899784 RepID=UPI001E414688|nr:hypothetical protein [Vibrio salinus]MCE0493880.1 hypothetical protein [Vibrio salinus]
MNASELRPHLTNVATDAIAMINILRLSIVTLAIALGFVSIILVITEKEEIASVIIATLPAIVNQLSLLLKDCENKN